MGAIGYVVKLSTYFCDSSGGESTVWRIGRKGGKLRAGGTRMLTCGIASSTYTGKQYTSRRSMSRMVARDSQVRTT